MFPSYIEQLVYTLRVSMWYMGTHYIVHTGVQMHALLPPDCTTRFNCTCSTGILA